MKRLQWPHILRKWKMDMYMLPIGVIQIIRIEEVIPRELLVVLDTPRNSPHSSQQWNGGSAYQKLPTVDVASIVSCQQYRKLRVIRLWKYRQLYFDNGIKAYGCSNDEMKRLLIIYLYGGGFNNWALNLDVSKCDSGVVKFGFIMEFESFALSRKSITPIHRLIAAQTLDQRKLVADIKLERGYCVLVCPTRVWIIATFRNW